MILANRAPGDNQAISALGDMLKEYGWIHAAHVWYVVQKLKLYYLDLINFIPNFYPI